MGERTRGAWDTCSAHHVHLHSVFLTHHSCEKLTECRYRRGYQCFELGDIKECPHPHPSVIQVLKIPPLGPDSLGLFTLEAARSLLISEFASSTAGEEGVPQQAHSQLSPGACSLVWDQGLALASSMGGYCSGHTRHPEASSPP